MKVKKLKELTDAQLEAHVHYLGRSLRYLTNDDIIEYTDEYVRMMYKLYTLSSDEMIRRWEKPEAPVK